jgi:AcrR family transcriptional regulator
VVEKMDRVPRGRGRPRGTTPQGLESRRRLYEIAVRLIASRGWHRTTLRDIAQEADVSVGLLYRYFPSKRAIVLALYEDLSSEYATRASQMPPGRWRERFVFALRASLEVLRPHRGTLAALVPVLIGDGEDGLFAPGTAFSRIRVEQVFREAVLGSTDAPRLRLGSSLGRLLYFVHLATILWWLLDKSPEQWATDRLVVLMDRALPLAALALGIPKIGALVVVADGLVRASFFDKDLYREE